MCGVARERPEHAFDTYMPFEEPVIRPNVSGVLFLRCPPPRGDVGRLPAPVQFDSQSGGRRTHRAAVSDVDVSRISWIPNSCGSQPFSRWT